MAVVVFLLFVAFLFIGGYIVAKRKREKEITSEKPGDQYIRRAYASWKRASAFSRFMALSSAGLKDARRAKTLSNLDWNRLPVEVQLLLASFQFIMETHPDLLTTKQEREEAVGVGVDPLAEQFEAMVRDLMSKPSPPRKTERELRSLALAQDTSVSNLIDDDSEEEKQAGFVRHWSRPRKNV